MAQDWMPPSATPVKEKEWTPPSAVPVDETKELAPEQSAKQQPSSIAMTISNKLTQPLTNKISQGVNDYVAEPLMSYGDRTPGMLGDVARGTGAFISNFGQGVENTFTSPLGIATMGLPIGAAKAGAEGLPTLANSLNTASRVAAAPIAARGAYDMYNEPDIMGKGMGAANLAVGALGMRSQQPKLGITNPLANDILQRGQPNTFGAVPKSAFPSGNYIPPVPNASNSIVQRLFDALDQSKLLNKEQRAIYAKERSEKLGKMESINTPGQQGFFQRRGALKGEHTKVQIEPIKLQQHEIDALYNIIAQHPASIGFNEIHAGDGLTKLLSGQVPVPSEVASLHKIFGNGIVDRIKKISPLAGKSLLAEGLNLPKSIMASMDMSAPLRQGVGLIHRKEYWQSLWPMIKAFGSDKVYRGIIESIEAKPTYKLMRESGLALTDLLSTKEEAFLSRFADRIPGIRQSERAYIGFLDKLRADTFDSLVKDAMRTGIDPNKDLAFAKELANYVNTATGRGKLYEGNPGGVLSKNISLEKSADALNSIFFSPRLIASRINMMTKFLRPSTYTQETNPFIRKQYLKSLFGIAGFGTTLATAASMAGAEVSLDPTNSDFGKVKIGDTRLDFYGGHQQYIVAAARLLMNERTSSTTGRSYELGTRFGGATRLSTIADFASQKTSPAVSFALDMLRAKDPAGSPIRVPKAIMDRYTPLMLNDLYELYQSDPSLLPAGAAGWFGAGLQTYGQESLGGEADKALRDVTDMSMPRR